MIGGASFAGLGTAVEEVVAVGAGSGEEEDDGEEEKEGGFAGADLRRGGAVGLGAACEAGRGGLKDGGLRLIGWAVREGGILFPLGGEAEELTL